MAVGPPYRSVLIVSSHGRVPSSVRHAVDSLAYQEHAKLRYTTVHNAALGLPELPNFSAPACILVEVDDPESESAVRNLRSAYPDSDFVFLRLGEVEAIWSGSTQIDIDSTDAERSVYAVLSKGATRLREPFRWTPPSKTLWKDTISQKPEPGFDIYIDPGAATSEELQDVLEALSDLYVATGGEGIEFKTDGQSLTADVAGRR